MLKRHNNTIHKLFFKSKLIKVILSSMTRIRLIVSIENFKEASSVNHVYIEEDTKIEETTIVDIITTTYPIRSNAISVINLDTNQVNI